VSRAAHDGRVSDLFVTDDVERWGTFEPATGTMSIEDGPGIGVEDLLNLAAIYALRSGARVHVPERPRMPDNADIAAVFRYRLFADGDRPLTRLPIDGPSTRNLPGG
jgi:hypothetical protein